MQPHRYTILLTPEEDGGFTATSPFFPGLVTFGETRDEAIAMALDAAKGLLLVKLEYGDPIPIEVDAPELATIEVDLPSLRAQLAAEKVTATA
ncbi:MAG TPA: type II toxin-antitoxin system HicB family antitoxin [Thermomicrobiales bacterium]|jgi:predicted RNase H-like HicB family nuclease